MRNASGQRADAAPRMELPLRSNDPFALLTGKRAASPHIASGWKDDSTEAEPNGVSVSLLGSNALALAAGGIPYGIHGRKY